MGEQHTPGPWIFGYHRTLEGPNPPEGEPLETGDERASCCELLAASLKSPDNPAGDVISSCECCEAVWCCRVADLRLIAAAPELLAMCERLLEAYIDEGGPTDVDTLKLEAQALIVKATKETPDE